MVSSSFSGLVGVPSTGIHILVQACIKGLVEAIEQGSIDTVGYM